jgi:hypothetical protein
MKAPSTLSAMPDVMNFRKKGTGAFLMSVVACQRSFVLGNWLDVLEMTIAIMRRVIRLPSA